MTPSHTFKRGAQRVLRKPFPTFSLTGAPPQAQQTWWSQRFISVLESFKLGGRLARGKAYAQEAKVLKITLSHGVVSSAVQGSRKASYRISIKLDPLSDHAWRHVLGNLTRKAIYASEMLMDKMPTDIERVFSQAGVSLFPERLEDLVSECDCPDWSNPCKHIAATYYVLAQHFDLDPFLVFAWRGRLKSQILRALRNYWRQGRPRGEAPFSQQELTPKLAATFWQGRALQNPMTALDPFSKSLPDSSIKQLGPAPLGLGPDDLGDLIAQCYQITSDEIRAWAEAQLKHQTLIKL